MEEYNEPLEDTSIDDTPSTPEPEPEPTSAEGHESPDEATPFDKPLPYEPDQGKPIQDGPEPDNSVQTQEEQSEEIEKDAAEPDYETRKKIAMEKMKADAEERKSILMKLLKAIANAVRYVIDPSYRHDCQMMASLERRADINAQLKAYEARKADILKDSMDEVNKVLDKNAKEFQNEEHSERKEYHEEENKKEQNLTGKIATVEKITESIKSQQCEPKSPEAKLQSVDRYGLLELAKDLTKDIQSKPEYEEKLNNLVKTLGVYRDLLAKGDGAIEARNSVVRAVGDIVNQQIEDKIQEMKEENKSQEISAGQLRKSAVYKCVEQNYRSILVLNDSDISKAVAKNALEKCLISEENTHEKQSSGEPFDERARLNVCRNFMKTYPQIVRAFDAETQKKQLVISALMRVPEALMYMDSAAVDDRTIWYIEKRVENGRTSMKDVRDKLTTVAHVGAAGVLMDKLDKYLEEKDKEQGDIVTERGLGGTEYGYDESQWQIPDEVMAVAEEMREDISEIPQDFLPVPDEAIEQTSAGMVENKMQGISPQETEQQQQEQLTSWMQMPEFASAIQEALSTSQYDMFGGPSSEELKSDVIQTNPSLYQYLPDDEKTISITIEAVSRDLSLMQYVPEEDKMPEYEDRDILKEQIIEKAGELAKTEAAHSEHQNVRTVINEKFSKVTGIDTKETKEMKKKLKANSFKLAEELGKVLGKDQDAMSYES